MITRKRIWEIMESKDPGDRAGVVFNGFFILLIVLNVVAVIVGSVQRIATDWAVGLEWFERVSVFIFSAEYLARLWACVEEERYRRPVRGRLRFAVSFMALVDLMAFVPFYLPLDRLDMRAVRILRLFRVLRLLKLGRYYSSLRLLGAVFRDRREELILTTVMMAMLLILSACFMYYCEHDANPAVFSSIPATLWWSVETLTTVGYGDICPITPLGKLLGSVIAILGIGMFALPTGILGSGFIEQIQRKRTAPEKTVCPHCGRSLDETGGNGDS